jgi:hypothetical membrane protein
MLPYTGRMGERFSPLNHFISELGQVGVSELAWLFNLGLILGGVLFVPFVAGLALALRSRWRWLGLAAGLVAAASLAGVGLFPMNRLAPHIVAALTYFRAGLVMVLGFGVAILRQRPGERVINRRVNLAGLAALAAYAGFLSYMAWLPEAAGASLDPSGLTSRPVVWPLAVLEWSILATTVAWFLAVGLGYRPRPAG